MRDLTDRDQFKELSHILHFDTPKGLDIIEDENLCSYEALHLLAIYAKPETLDRTKRLITHIVTSGVELSGHVRKDITGEDKLQRPLINTCVGWDRAHCLVEFLLSLGANPNEQDDTGWTAMHQVGLSGAYDLIDPLLKRGADINAEDNKGQTPLDFAISYATCYGGGIADHLKKWPFFLTTRKLLEAGSRPLTEEEKDTLMKRALEVGCTEWLLWA